MASTTTETSGMDVPVKELTCITSRLVDTADILPKIAFTLPSELFSAYDCGPALCAKVAAPKRICPIMLPLFPGKDDGRPLIGPRVACGKLIMFLMLLNVIPGTGMFAPPLN